MWLDNLANTLVTWAGYGFDPDGCKLPAFKAKQENRAKLPEREKKIADVVNEDLLSDEDLRLPNWRYTYAGMNSKRLQDYKKDVVKTAAVLVDFDELPADMHGITEREYWEMLAYTPQLKDLRIASIVKAERLKGGAKKTWAQVAKETRQTEQTIKHYSSALEKANPSPVQK